MFLQVQIILKGIKYGSASSYNTQVVTQSECYNNDWNVSWMTRCVSHFMFIFFRQYSNYYFNDLLFVYIFNGIFNIINYLMNLSLVFRRIVIDISLSPSLTLEFLYYFLDIGIQI